jgi:hypothetical protein
VIGNAVKVMRSATGEEPDDYGSESEGKDPPPWRLGERGRPGRGAAGMSARKRRQIAKKAAKGD